MDIFEPYMNALRRAAEEVYKSEIVDTLMETSTIKEVAEKYEYYANEEDKRVTIRNCLFETKEEWIENKIREWMKE